MDIPNISTLLLIAVPFALIHYGLAIYCIIDIVKHDVKNLNKVGWILIVLLINIFGSVAYLLFGRRGDEA